jgi:hypothetical protein
VLKSRIGSQFFFFFLLNRNYHATPADNAHEMLNHKMAELAAQMAKVDHLEKEREKREAEEKAVCKAEVEAVRLAAEKAARKAMKKGKKRAMEELGANAEAEGGATKPNKRAKTVDAGAEEDLESAEVPCKR